MSRLSQVAIIYNPNSTGNGKKNADSLSRKLKNAGMNIAVHKTKHAGHAEEIAKEFAQSHAAGMIISSSGDGGYHEVVNGVLGSKHPKTVCGVLPSGNANDNFSYLHHGDIVERIQKHDVQSVDVLKITTPSWTRYAHSYAGLGMTPHIGKELTKHELNRLTETWIVIKNIFSIRPIRIRRDGKTRSYNSLVFSNIGTMSKYLTLSTEASATDGLFELTATKDDSIARLFRHLFRAVFNKVESTPQFRQYTFTALRNMLIQLDGEIYTVLSGEVVTVSCQRKALRTII